MNYYEPKYKKGEILIFKTVKGNFLNKDIDDEYTTYKIIYIDDLNYYLEDQHISTDPYIVNYNLTVNIIDIDETNKYNFKLGIGTLLKRI